MELDIVTQQVKFLKLLSQENRIFFKVVTKINKHDWCQSNMQHLLTNKVIKYMKAKEIKNINKDQYFKATTQLQDNFHI